MTRLLVFLCMIGAIVGVLTLNSYKGETISRAKFDFEKTKENYEAKKAEIAALSAPKTEKIVEAVAKVPELVLDTPTLKAGHALYKKCIACHGKMGEGKKSQKAPKISGQYEWYLIKQIQDMKDQVRVNKVMEPFIKRLSAQEIKDLSHYISKLPW